jgi:hypothetical protein
VPADLPGHDGLGLQQRGGRPANAQIIGICGLPGASPARQHSRRNGYLRGPSLGVATLRDGPCLLAFRYRSVLPDHAGDSIRGVVAAAGGRLPGRDAERFGMRPAVMLSQDLAEAAGPVRHGTVADLAAGDRQLGDGHREAPGR